jgi:NAD(P)H-hydrate epimerase
VSLPLVGRDQARAIDARAIGSGIPGLLLMENAGRGAAELLLSRMRERAARPLIVGGLGQNGGDAWVVARHLAIAGVRAEVLLLGDPARVSGDARTMLDALAALGIAVTPIAEGGLERLAGAAASARVIVDGIFGTGLDRPVEGFRAEAIRLLAAAGVPCFALDLPSGLDADTGRPLGIALPAALTATFAAHKRGLHQHPGAALAGEVVLVPIGIPAPSGGSGLLLERSDPARLVPPRAADAHKGTAGRVLVIAGSPGRTGAALLSGLGALRAGAGLVTIAVRGPARGALDAKVIELMTAEIPEPVEAGVAAALRECESADACAIGPGGGLDERAREYLARLAVEVPIPAVLDADALTAIAGDPTVLRTARAARVLTPHPGEAARLLGTSSAEVQAARYQSAESLAARTAHVVVLKGARSVISAPDGRTAVCPIDAPALAAAGTGDVLSGVIAALLRSLPPFEAACAGVVLHAMAGALAAHSDRGLLAREVADAIPRALEASRQAACAR